ncbi:hypothetical protein GJ496_000088 [Pomphorhynchus laevis]|nr:hypothetical protein GJ496_000088 [Pomphorhynchus laevis]
MKSPLQGHDRANTLLQRIPRHMRRKASAYDRKRFPKSFQTQFQNVLEMGKKIKRRAIKRLRSRKQKPPNYTKKNVTWIASHLWHAKRFHMATKWGWRVPMFRNDKGVRVVYRAVHFISACQDQSYYRCFEFKGNMNTLTELKFSFEPKGLSIQDQYEQELLLYYDQQLLGPCFIGYNKNLELIWIWAHVCIYDQIKFICELNEIKELIRFRVYGPLATSLIDIQLEGPLSIVPKDNQILNFKMNDPRLARYSLTDVMENHLKLQASIEVNHVDHSLWSLSVREQVISSFANIDDQKVKQGNVLAASFPVQLIFRGRLGNESDGFGSHWDMIIPLPYAKYVWHSLVYGGARPIGMREMKQIYLEVGKCVFPDEFPDTLAGQTDNELEALSSYDQYSRRPISKRINYDKLGVADPFRFHWKELQDYWANILNVQQLNSKLLVQRFSAAIHDGTYLHPVLIYLRNRPLSSNSFILISKSSANLQQNHPSLIEKDLNKFTRSENFLIIGYVTHCSFSMLRGRCIAKGMIISEYLNQNQYFVQNIRNTDIAQCKVTPLNKNC